MANVQKQFEVFNEAIKLKHFDENATLREKRDIIRNKLLIKLPQIFEAYGEECPEIEFRNQGSYEIGTGIIPLGGDFDIDQGLYFQVGSDAYPDPVVLKKRIFEALDGHTDSVCIRRSCVTVFYHKDGEPVYHVDIAVYSDGSKNTDRKSRIAKGKENSSDEYRFWEISNPQALTEQIYERFVGNDRSQFRRIVQYLKRWKDENFTSDGNAAPLGIGLTVVTFYYLQTTYIDRIAGKADDLNAMKNLIRAILNQFRLIYDESGNRFVKRLVITLPVEPWNDLFEKMTNKQMENFGNRLEKLLEALCAADQIIDPVQACTELQKVFGADFPIPEITDTAKRHQPAIASSSNSAQ